MERDYRKGVIELIRKNGYRRIAEIGFWKCELSRKIWNVEHVDELHLIDPLSLNSVTIVYENKIFKMTMGGACDMNQGELDALFDWLVKGAPEKAKFYRMTSEQASKKIKDLSLDFVFIDAVHFYENCKQDIGLWLPKIADGGMIAGDDFSARFEGVARAVKEMLPGFKNYGRLWWSKIES